MNILRHLHLSSALRSPDEPVADPVVEPVVDLATPVADPAPSPVADPPAPDPAPAPVADPAPAAHGNRGQTPWFQRVIAEVREDKRQAAARAEAAEAKNAELQAIIERIQAGNPDPAAPRAPAQPAAPQQPLDFASAVKAQAAKDRLYEDTLAVRAAGEGKFADFNQSLGILTAVGATSDEFVADLLAVDKTGAHVIIDKLAKDPEKAASLVSMDSRRRIAELTRMADAPKTDPTPAPVPAPVPAAPAVSRAPAPAPRIAAVQPAADLDPTTPDGNEKMSDAQWEKWAKSQGIDGLLKRRA